MHGFEPRVVVNKHEQILVSGVMSSDKGRRDISMDQTARVGWLIERGIVGMASGICCGAGCTAIEATMRERRWSIS
eukprot:4013698-Pleurochrysis_carterae.AAC.1